MTESAIIAMIIAYANIFGVDPLLAKAVARVESNYSANAISKDGLDVGIFQLRRTSYPDYSIKELKNPRLNTLLGILHLKRVKDTCVHKANLSWLVCWNYGEQNAKHVKYPALFPYVRKVASEMRSSK